jgi:hypothetical protein
VRQWRASPHCGPLRGGDAIFFRLRAGFAPTSKPPSKLQCGMYVGRSQTLKTKPYEQANEKSGLHDSSLTRSCPFPCPFAPRNTRLPCPHPFHSRAASDILTHTPPVEQDSDADGVLRRAGSGVTGRGEVEASDESLCRRPHAGAPERDRAERARSWAKGSLGIRDLLTHTKETYWAKRSLGIRVLGGPCGLVDLDGEILARLWPAQRVVAGQNTCKYLRTELRKCGRVVLQARNTLFSKVRICTPCSQKSAFARGAAGTQRNALFSKVSIQ